MFILVFWEKEEKNMYPILRLMPKNTKKKIKASRKNKTKSWRIGLLTF